VLKPQIEKKAKIVRDIEAKVGKAQIGILADFSGIKVGPMAQLRRQVKEAGGELKVAKNTLLRRAAADASLIAPVAGELKGPNALVLGYEDPVALAKLLVKFAQDLPLFKIKGGVIGGQTLTVAEVTDLSKLPAREVLLAQLLGVLQATPQALVNVLSGVIRNFMNVLVAIRDEKEEAEGQEAAQTEAPEEAAAAAPEAPGGKAPAEVAEAAPAETEAQAAASGGEETPPETGGTGGEEA
jgi:large subunit ribosomal protein L10